MPDPVDFARDIRPLLSDRCFLCHGPGSEDPGGGLRLDLEEEAVDELGFGPIVPGDPGASELMSRVRLRDPERRMPPESSHLSLDDAEVELLRRWIAEGASYGEHWAFVAPRRTAPPAPEHAEWCFDPIDAFVLSALERAGLTPATAADPATLLRRVHLDLTGLPPRPAAVDSFVADPSKARFTGIVDELLASAAHAEHMTAHWLDVARYADTFGYQADVNMNVWPWRDWVLGAFQEGLPYDQFVVQQLAGDLMPGANESTRLATTFNRLHRQTNEGGSVEEEYRVESVCDRVETMSAAFLGLTMGCARCHDHKFDPISQADFFGLFAYFDGIDESGLYSHFTNAVPTPALDLPDGTQALKLAELEAQCLEAEAAAHGLRGPLGTSQLASFLGNLGRPEEETYEGNKTRRVIRSLVEAEGDAPVPSAHVRGAIQFKEVEGRDAALLDGESSITFPGVGEYRRSDPFSIHLQLRASEFRDRAVVLHRSKAWTDSGSRGYQILLEEGRLSFALIHFWPGDAIAIRTERALELGQWTEVLVTYDGSSRASGMHLYLDGKPVAVEVVRDRLTRTILGGQIEPLTIGSRFRDRGFRGGAVARIGVYDYELSPFDAAAIAGGGERAWAAEDEAPVLLEAQRAARRARDDHRDRIRQIMTMREAPDLPAARRTAYILGRGHYADRGEPIDARTPSFLPTLLERPAPGRLGLAQWLVHPDHPLTARVQVDRLWRMVFGKGLVPTPEDLGSQCPPPVHQALLDTLARDLVESGWDSRRLLRRMVLSSTYAQASERSPESAAGDPEGALYSHAIGRRHSAETIRDSILFASGELVQTVGGPSVMPYQPPGLWQEKSGKVYAPGRGDSLRRRSLYTFWRRTSPPPTMALFDAPTREVCRVARPSTTTPLQALVLWNDPQFVAASVALAREAVHASRADDAGRVDFLVRALTSRPATERELEAMGGLLGDQRAAFGADPEAARSLAGYDLERVCHPATGEVGAGEGLEATEATEPTEAVEIAATAVVASALLGLDEVVIRR